MRGLAYPVSIIRITYGQQLSFAISQKITPTESPSVWTICNTVALRVFNYTIHGYIKCSAKDKGVVCTSLIYANIQNVLLRIRKLSSLTHLHYLIYTVSVNINSLCC